MRSAKESGDFPYKSKTVCYIAVDGQNGVRQVDQDFSSVTKAYGDAVSGNARLFAVWPGQYRSDLFEVDDLNAFADAFGIPRPDDHTHKITWALSPSDDGKSSYAHVRVVFECGCELSRNNIAKFALDMKAQKGWDVATSKGLSWNSNAVRTEYTVFVRRGSL